MDEEGTTEAFEEYCRDHLVFVLSSFWFAARAAGVLARPDPDAIPRQETPG
jgi:hypothetical protein